MQIVHNTCIVILEEPHQKLLNFILRWSTCICHRLVILRHVELRLNATGWVNVFGQIFVPDTKICVSIKIPIAHFVTLWPISFRRKDNYVVLILEKLVIAEFVMVDCSQHLDVTSQVTWAARDQNFASDHFRSTIVFKILINFSLQTRI